MNAEEFLRFIRRRTHAKDMLSNLRVASLGLGDTNYDKFCNCSKQLVKRLGELGATPLLPAAFADEGVGLDSTIDPWLEALFPLIKTSYTASTAEPSVIAPSHLAHENKNDPETIMPLSPMAMMQAMKSLNVERASRRGVVSSPYQDVPGKSQADLLEKAAVAAAHGVGVHVAHSLAADVPHPPNPLHRGVAPNEQTKQNLIASEPLPLSRSSLSLHPGYLTFHQLFPELKFSTEEQLPSENLIPPFSVSSAAKFFPPAQNPHFEVSYLVGESNNQNVLGVCDAPSNPPSSLRAPQTNGPVILVPIKNSRSLCTTASVERKVLSLTFDVKGTPFQGNWGPGDVAGIFAPNHSDLVSNVVKRLGLKGDNKVAFIIPSPKPGSDLLKSDSLRAPCLPTWIPNFPNPTLTDLFSWAVDITSPPKKALLRMLGDSCSDSREKDILYFLCGRSKSSQDAFSALVERQYASLLDLLLLFPSSNPTLPLLLSILPPLAPRFYSLTSSPLSSPCELSIAFSITRYTIHCQIPGGHDIQRPGIATPWLEALSEGMCGNSSEAPPAVRLFVRPARTFLPPPSLDTPMIMVAHGTGLAPFISFLAHRAAKRSALKSSSVAVNQGLWRRGLFLSIEDENGVEQEKMGPAILFYGNRSPAEDWLFREEIEGWRTDGTLTAVHTAWSRNPVSNGGKVYVQDLIRGEEGVRDGNHDGPLGCGASLASLLISGGAHFYVCGKAAMANDVKAVVLDVLKRYGLGFGIEEALRDASTDAPSSQFPDAGKAAEEYLKHLFKVGRYSEDKWG